MPFHSRFGKAFRRKATIIDSIFKGFCCYFFSCHNSKKKKSQGENGSCNLPSPGY